MALEECEKALSMDKEKICPLCFLKMTQIALQSWQCKCGHREKEEADVEEEDIEEPKRRRMWGLESDGRFRETKQTLHKGLRET